MFRFARNIFTSANHDFFSGKKSLGAPGKFLLAIIFLGIISPAKIFRPEYCDPECFRCYTGTGAGKPSFWTTILTQWPNRKILVLERLSTSHKSASNITHSAIASRKRSARVLRTVQHAVSAYSLERPPVQCSVLCMPRCCTTPHHLHNTNANRVLVPQYRDASAVVRLCVVGKRCHTSMYHA